MKISQIVESSTTSGAIASVPMGTGSMQRRAGGSMFKGKKTKKPFYEENISEEDLIIIPGQGMKRRTGFIAHDPDRAEREGETLKNSLHTIIRVATHLNDQLSAQDDFPEWVSEKIGAIKSMMTGVMDYLVSDKEMHGKISATEMTGGVVAGGVAFEGASEKVVLTDDEIIALLDKLLRVVTTVSTPEQLKSAKQYYKLVARKLGKDIRDLYTHENTKIKKLARNINSILRFDQEPRFKVENKFVQTKSKGLPEKVKKSK